MWQCQPANTLNAPQRPTLGDRSAGWEMLARSAQATAPPHHTLRCNGPIIVRITSKKFAKVNHHAGWHATVDWQGNRQCDVAIRR
eukprot:8003031-Pyramimonas_sp.AAC.1